MAKFIVTLHSAISSLGALGVYDTEEGLVYVQIDELSESLTSHQMRGIAINGEHLYVVTTASLRIYHFNAGPGPILFKLHKEIILPEWLAGGEHQADLLPLYFSKGKRRLYIGCNLLATIEEFDESGNFLSRRHLNQVSSEIFPRSRSFQKKYPYGHIRSITESPNGDLVATVASRSGSDSGSVVNLDTGKLLKAKLKAPHGGLYLDGKFFVQNVKFAKLDAYSCDQYGKIDDLLWRFKALDETNGKPINIRGQVLSDKELFVSVLNFSREEPKMISAYLVGFDSCSGKQKSYPHLPDLEEFRMPRIFFMVEAPRQLSSRLKSPITLVSRHKIIPGKIHQEVVTSNDKEGYDTALYANPQEQSQGLKSAQVVISVDKVSLSYRRSANWGIGKNKHLRKHRDFMALSDVSFEIKEGDFVGLIGRNGSGKSTMGMLLSRIMTPDSGHLKAFGSIQLLALGVGFRSDLTGRENAFLNGTLMGLSRKQVRDEMDSIEEFSELGDFIDEPVRTYSSGMRARLAFAVATAVKPDVLILDEVLSTGDESFRKKAESRMKIMQDNAKTVIMISHSAAQLRKLCNRILWLDRGQLLMDGSTRQVLDEYQRFCQNPELWYEKNNHTAS